MTNQTPDYGQTITITGEKATLLRAMLKSINNVPLTGEEKAAIEANRSDLDRTAIKLARNCGKAFAAKIDREILKIIREATK